MRIIRLRELIQAINDDPGFDLFQFLATRDQRRTLGVCRALSGRERRHPFGRDGVPVVQTGNQSPTNRSYPKGATAPFFVV
jgi:hypothetical protein